MASSTVAITKCTDDPCFAVICSFFEKFSKACGIVQPTFSELQEMLEFTDEVPPQLVDLIIKLLKKARKNVPVDKWERVLVRLSCLYSPDDSWELERLGYKNLPLSKRLIILKILQDAQFDWNAKFKNDINKLSSEELRQLPVGRDIKGKVYWALSDCVSDIRVYQEDTDEDTWDMVAKDGKSLIDLIRKLDDDQDSAYRKINSYLKTSIMETEEHEIVTEHLGKPNLKPMDQKIISPLHNNPDNKIQDLAEFSEETTDSKISKSKTSKTEHEEIVKDLNIDKMEVKENDTKNIEHNDIDNTSTDLLINTDPGVDRVHADNEIDSNGDVKESDCTPQKELQNPNSDTESPSLKTIINLKFNKIKPVIENDILKKNSLEKLKPFSKLYVFENNQNAYLNALQKIDSSTQQSILENILSETLPGQSDDDEKSAEHQSSLLNGSSANVPNKSDCIETSELPSELAVNVNEDKDELQVRPIFESEKPVFGEIDESEMAVKGEKSKLQNSGECEVKELKDILHDQTDKSEEPVRCEKFKPSSIEVGAVSNTISADDHAAKTDTNVIISDSVLNATNGNTDILLQNEDHSDSPNLNKTKNCETELWEKPITNSSDNLESCKGTLGEHFSDKPESLKRKLDVLENLENNAEHKKFKYADENLDAEIECRNENIILDTDDNDGLSEEIEEPVFIVRGVGYGEECNVGNPGEDSSSNSTEENSVVPLKETENDSSNTFISNKFSDLNRVNNTNENPDLNDGIPYENRSSIRLNENEPILPSVDSESPVTDAKIIKEPSGYNTNFEAPKSKIWTIDQIFSSTGNNKSDKPDPIDDAITDLNVSDSSLRSKCTLQISNPKLLDSSEISNNNPTTSFPCFFGNLEPVNIPLTANNVTTKNNSAEIENKSKISKIVEYDSNDSLSNDSKLSINQDSKIDLKSDVINESQNQLESDTDKIIFQDLKTDSSDLNSVSSLNRDDVPNPSNDNDKVIVNEKMVKDFSENLERSSENRSLQDSNLDSDKNREGVWVENIDFEHNNPSILPISKFHDISFSSNRETVNSQRSPVRESNENSLSSMPESSENSDIQDPDGSSQSSSIRRYNEFEDTQDHSENSLSPNFRKLPRDRNIHLFDESTQFCDIRESGGGGSNNFQSDFISSLPESGTLQSFQCSNNENFRFPYIQKNTPPEAHVEDRTPSDAEGLEDRQPTGEGSSEVSQESNANSLSSHEPLPEESLEMCENTGSNILEAHFETFENTCSSDENDFKLENEDLVQKNEDLKESVQRSIASSEANSVDVNVDSTEESDMPTFPDDTSDNEKSNHSIVSTSCGSHVTMDTIDDVEIKSRTTDISNPSSVIDDKLTMDPIDILCNVSDAQTDTRLSVAGSEVSFSSLISQCDDNPNPENSVMSKTNIYQPDTVERNEICMEPELQQDMLDKIDQDNSEHENLKSDFGFISDSKSTSKITENMSEYLAESSINVYSPTSIVETSKEVPALASSKNSKISENETEFKTCSIPLENEDEENMKVDIRKIENKNINSLDKDEPHNFKNFDEIKSKTVEGDTTIETNKIIVGDEIADKEDSITDNTISNPLDKSVIKHYENLNLKTYDNSSVDELDNPELVKVEEISKFVENKGNKDFTDAEPALIKIQDESNTKNAENVELLEAETVEEYDDKSSEESKIFEKPKIEEGNINNMSKEFSDNDARGTDQVDADIESVSKSQKLANFANDQIESKLMGMFDQPKPVSENIENLTSSENLSDQTKSAESKLMGMFDEPKSASEDTSEKIQMEDNSENLSDQTRLAESKVMSMFDEPKLDSENKTGKIEILDNSENVSDQTKLSELKLMDMFEKPKSDSEDKPGKIGILYNSENPSDQIRLTESKVMDNVVEPKSASEDKSKKIENVDDSENLSEQPRSVESKLMDMFDQPKSDSLNKTENTEILYNSENVSNQTKLVESHLMGTVDQPKSASEDNSENSNDQIKSVESHLMDTFDQPKSVSEDRAEKIEILDNTENSSDQIKSVESKLMEKSVSLGKIENTDILDNSENVSDQTKSADLKFMGIEPKSPSKDNAENIENADNSEISSDQTKLVESKMMDMFDEPKSASEDNAEKIEILDNSEKSTDQTKSVESKLMDMFDGSKSASEYNAEKIEISDNSEKSTDQTKSVESKLKDMFDEPKSASEDNAKKIEILDNSEKSTDQTKSMESKLMNTFDQRKSASKESEKIEILESSKSSNDYTKSSESFINKNSSDRVESKVKLNNPKLQKTTQKLKNSGKTKIRSNKMNCRKKEISKIFKHQSKTNLAYKRKISKLDVRLREKITAAAKKNREMMLKKSGMENRFLKLNKKSKFAKTNKNVNKTPKKKECVKPIDNDNRKSESPKIVNKVKHCDEKMSTEGESVDQNKKSKIKEENVDDDDNSVAQKKRGRKPKTTKQPTEPKSKCEKPEKKNQPTQRHGADAALLLEASSSARGVRQSLRIAQIKIREQSEGKYANRTNSFQKIKSTSKLQTTPGKHDKSEKDSKKSDKSNKKFDKESKKSSTVKLNKSKRKKAISDDEDVDHDETISESTSRKRKEKNKFSKRSFNINKAWKGSSGSSEEEEEEEEQYEEEEQEDLQFAARSDHEFSPESDLEDDKDYAPVKKARTAHGEPVKSEKQEDDLLCKKCKKAHQPEWILLCDECDSGWHASCLQPPLFVIPEGDWFCPPCQHNKLLSGLRALYGTYNAEKVKKENDILRQKRLEFVTVNASNIIIKKSDMKDHSTKGHSGSEESQELSDTDSEPMYTLRVRKQTSLSYRFNEFDDLINSAIQGEMVPYNEGENDELAANEESQDTHIVSVPLSEALIENVITHSVEKKEMDENKGKGDLGSDREGDDREKDIENAIIARPTKKKAKKLTQLEVSSEEDRYSDEDFKGSEVEEDEEEYAVEDTDDSGESGYNKSRSGTRRSTRNRRIRYDKDFVNDDSEDDRESRRKNKSKRAWDSSSDSENDDSTWGKRKKNRYSSSFKPSSKKRKRIKFEGDSDDEKKPKQPRRKRVTYGLVSDLNDDSTLLPRTRGRKINYLDFIESDSDQEAQSSKAKLGLSSDEEYIQEEDEDVYKDGDIESKDKTAEVSLVGSAGSNGTKKSIAISKVTSSSSSMKKELTSKAVNVTGGLIKTYSKKVPINPIGGSVRMATPSIQPTVGIIKKSATTKTTRPAVPKQPKKKEMAAYTGTVIDNKIVLKKVPTASQFPTHVGMPVKQLQKPGGSTSATAAANTTNKSLPVIGNTIATSTAAKNTSSTPTTTTNAAGMKTATPIVRKFPVRPGITQIRPTGPSQQQPVRPPGTSATQIRPPIRPGGNVPLIRTPMSPSAFVGMGSARPPTPAMGIAMNMIRPTTTSSNSGPTTISTIPSSTPMSNFAPTVMSNNSGPTVISNSGPAGINNSGLISHPTSAALSSSGSTSVMMSTFASTPMSHPGPTTTVAGSISASSVAQTMIATPPKLFSTVPRLASITPGMTHASTEVQTDKDRIMTPFPSPMHQMAPPSGRFVSNMYRPRNPNTPPFNVNQAFQRPFMNPPMQNAGLMNAQRLPIIGVGGEPVLTNKRKGRGRGKKQILEHERNQILGNNEPLPNQLPTAVVVSTQNIVKAPLPPPNVSSQDNIVRPIIQSATISASALQYLPTQMIPQSQLPLVSSMAGQSQFASLPTPRRKVSTPRMKKPSPQLLQDSPPRMMAPGTMYQTFSNAATLSNVKQEVIGIHESNIDNVGMKRENAPSAFDGSGPPIIGRQIQGQGGVGQIQDQGTPVSMIKQELKEFIQIPDKPPAKKRAPRKSSGAKTNSTPTLQTQSYRVPFNPTVPHHNIYNLNQPGGNFAQRPIYVSQETGGAGGGPMGGTIAARSLGNNPPTTSSAIQSTPVSFYNAPYSSMPQQRPGKPLPLQQSKIRHRQPIPQGIDQSQFRPQFQLNASGNFMKTEPINSDEGNKSNNPSGAADNKMERSSPSNTFNQNQNLSHQLTQLNAPSIILAGPSSTFSSSLSTIVGSGTDSLVTSKAPVTSQYSPIVGTQIKNNSNVHQSSSGSTPQQQQAQNLPSAVQVSHPSQIPVSSMQQLPLYATQFPVQRPYYTRPQTSLPSIPVAFSKPFTPQGTASPATVSYSLQPNYAQVQNPNFSYPAYSGQQSIIAVHVSTTNAQNQSADFSRPQILILQQQQPQPQEQTVIIEPAAPQEEQREETSEFGGLVSYFSSQRDDMDS